LSAKAKRVCTSGFWLFFGVVSLLVVLTLVSLGLLGEMQHFIARLSRTTQDWDALQSGFQQNVVAAEVPAMQQWKMNTDPQRRHVE